jgi:hypothetical protein
MKRVVAVALVAVASVAAACGGTVVFEEDGTADGATGSGAGGGPDDAVAPAALYVSDREGCAVEAPIEEAVASLTIDDGGGEALHVVELAYVDECTGAGGQHILARAVDGSRGMWLGAHACYFFDPDLVGERGAGLARASQTAGLASTSADACVTFPGETSGVTSDVRVTAIAVFPTVGDAQAYADAHGLFR